MTYKIISVGGTGQIVLHYYLQLYLLGVVKEEFDAVIIDSDDILPSIQAVRSFLAGLQYGGQTNESLGRAKIPTVEALRVRPTGGDTALEVLTGRKDWKRTETHPVYAFFNDDSLRQELKQGLFARPALSSVLTQEIFQSDSLRSSPNSTVIIVGAVTGGTGGGLTAPMLDAVRTFTERERIENVKVRAVLFGEYFRPQEGLIKDAVPRFQSNQTMVLRSFGEAEAAEGLHSYSIVGGPGVSADYERKTETEKEGKNIPWPNDEGNPFWQGVLALEHLLRDTAAEKVTKFEGREAQNFSTYFTLRGAELRLRKALSMVRMINKKGALLRLCNDPWSRWIWGEGMVEIAAHYWSIAASRESGKEGVADFPRELQRAFETLWRGEDKKLGLQDVFPNITQTERMRPGKMSSVRWPQVSEGKWARELFDDKRKAAQRAAATLLFWTLREVA
ncbi:MAG TPA: hypothetical protein VFA21_10570 [Pyrinomonadaceae bacterium]|nr:hypothetical protein [Pyrinomonadaceae bacterium]